MSNALDSNPSYGIVYSKYLVFDSNTKKLYQKNPKWKSGNLLKEMAFSNMHIPHGLTLIRSECFDKIGFFDSNFRTSGDREFNFRLAKNYKFLYLDQ